MFYFDVSKKFHINGRVPHLFLVQKPVANNILQENFLQKNMFLPKPFLCQKLVRGTSLAEVIKSCYNTFSFGRSDIGKKSKD